MRQWNNRSDNLLEVTELVAELTLNPCGQVHLHSINKGHSRLQGMITPSFSVPFFCYGSIKDRNGKDLTEAEDIKKRWQEYTEELYKRDLHSPDNHDGVITHTHLEPDILKCEVK